MTDLKQTSRKILSGPWIIPFLILQGGVIAFSAYSHWYVLAGVLGMIVIPYTLKYVHYGLMALILIHIVILKQSEEISLVEILFGVYFILFLAVWSFRKALLKRENLVQFPREYWLLVFLGLCFFSIIPNFVTGGDALQWFRDLVPFLTLFLYFPFADAMGDRRNVLLFAGAFFILALTYGVENIINYRENLQRAVLFADIAGSRQSGNEPLFLISIVVLTGMMIYMKSMAARFAASALLLFFGVTLALTFSRGYWLAGALGIGFVFLFIDMGRKIRFAVAAGFFALFILGAMYLLFGDITLLLSKSIIERAETLVSTQADISLQNRFSEAKSVWEEIAKNPIVGYGLGSAFSYFNLIRLVTLETFYTHNGFLFLWFKLGIFGMLSFLLFFFFNIRAGFQVFRRMGQSIEKGVVIGIICTLLTMLPLSITSPQFIQKDSLLIMALAFGFITAVQKRLAGETSAQTGPN